MRSSADTASPSPSHSVVTPGLDLRGAAGPLAAAILPILAWDVVTTIWPDVEFTPVIRIADALWVWPALALLALVTTRPDESPVLRRLVVAVILLGAAVCAARQIPYTAVWRHYAYLVEIGTGATAAALVAVRGLVFLSGRAVRVAELWALAGIQWALVAAAATVKVAADGRLEPVKGLDPAHRQSLADLWLVGVSVNAAAAVILAHVPRAAGVTGGGTVRDRAALVALVAANAGAIFTVVGWAWLGLPLMLAGGVFLLVSVATLFRGPARLLPLLALAAAGLLLLAPALRFIDPSGVFGGRFALSAGVVGLTALAAAHLYTAMIPPQLRPARLLATGTILALAGVALGLGVAVYASVEPGAYQVFPICGALQGTGTILVAVAAARSVGLARRIAPKHP